MKPLLTKEKDQPFWRFCTDGEYSMQDLTINKDKKSSTYLEGKVTFTGAEFDYFLMRRNQNYLDLEISYGVESDEHYTGLLSLVGDWNYQQRTCVLNVKKDDNYSKFERIIDKEVKIGREYDFVFYDFDSYSDTKYCSSEIVDSVYPDYAVDTGEDFPAWDNTKNYVPSQVEPDGSGGYYYFGDDRSFVTLSGKRYVCLVENTGQQPQPIPNETIYWKDITISTVLTYKQERAQFEFDDSEFNEFEKYWYKSSITTDNYERTVAGYKVKDMLVFLLQDTDFSLSDNWLNYASNVNADYEDMFVINTELQETITLDNVISIIGTLFNCEYRLEGYEITFKHYTELNQEWKGARPPEHDFSDRIDDICLYKGKDQNEVFEHRLNFSKSYNDTHNDSVLTYENEYQDSEKITGDYDVDFVFAINKSGKNCPVTKDSVTNFIQRDGELYNEYFIPSTLHQEFYFVGREFKIAEFQDAQVTLDIDYSEQVDFEAPPSLTFAIFLPNFDVLLPQGKARFEKIQFSITDNKFNLTCSLKYIS